MIRIRRSSAAVAAWRALALAVALVLGAGASVAAASGASGVVAGAEGASEAKDAKDAKKYGMSRPVAEKLLAAYDLLEAERYDEALEVVDALAERRKLKAPEIAQIHRFRAYIFVSQGRNDAATGEFEKSLALEAMDPVAERVMMYSLAQIYTEQGRYDQALALMNRWFAGEQNPKADAWFLKAMILVQQQNWADAAEPADRALALAEKPKESWLTLHGVIHTNLKNFDKVERDLAQLVELAPAKSQYWMQLAAVQHHLGQEEKAVATMQLAYQAGLLKTDKELRQLASMLFLRQQPFECAKVIEGAIAAGTMPADAESYRLMSNCYIAARESEKALEPLSKGAALASDGDMDLLLGQMHLQAERFDRAVEALSSALAKVRPEQRGSVHLLIGIAQLGADRLPEAERSFALAVDDAKVHRAAESYLKLVQDKRSAQAQPQVASSSNTGG